MSAVKVISASGETGADVGLPAEIFDAKVNVPLIHQVVVAQEAAARQGTHAAKTRGLVRGGGKKPYRQKGTGRARQGSTRAPQFAGGGTVHGPVPRSYEQRTPKKMKAAALRGALSDRARHGRVHVVTGFVTGDAPSTKEALGILAAAIGIAEGRARAEGQARDEGRARGEGRARSEGRAHSEGRMGGGAHALVVVGRDDVAAWKSLRNATGVHLLDPGQLNTYDVLVSDYVIFTEAALASFVARAGVTSGTEQEESQS